MPGSHCQSFRIMRSNGEGMFQVFVSGTSESWPVRQTVFNAIQHYEENVKFAEFQRGRPF